MTATIPKTMSCMEISEGQLVSATRPVPVPRDGEVLVRVHAAGINRPDVLQRKGGYAPPPGASDIPGLEVAGDIVALGDGVSNWKIGDQVCALVTGGGYGEYCTAPAPQCLPIPAGLDMDEAAALPETFFTVWSNVFDRAGLVAGETLLVHGGSSGIGTTAIQIAHHMGVEVIVTAGTDDKCGACEILGADHAINYRERDFVEAVNELTDGKGVNVILDMVGGDYVARNFEALAPDGRLVSIAFLTGSKVQIDLMPIMLKRLTLTGSTLRPRSVEFKAAIGEKLKAHIWPLIEDGKIAPFIHAAFPLSAAAEAHALMESSEHIGKIVLQM